MATQGFAKWSTTAATNATADAAVNWAEGQSPSSVNDSARAMMASAAKWRNDLYGVTSGLSTGGTSTAYTVTTNATFSAAADMDGAIFTILPHATSGAAPTLAVDGLTARAINSRSGVAVLTGAMVEDTPCLVRYTHATTEFILIGAAGADRTPVAAMMAYAGSSAPAGWLLCTGQAVSRTTYAALYAVIGDTYGAGNGVTTFNVPDIGGRVIAGKESTATRLTSALSGIDGATLASAGGAQTYTMLQANLPNVTLTTTIASGQGSHDHVQQYRSAPGGSGNGVAADVTASAVSPSAFSTSTATLPALTGTTPTGGSATPFNKVQPTIIANYIIFAGV